MRSQLHPHNIATRCAMQTGFVHEDSAHSSRRVWRVQHLEYAVSWDAKNTGQNSLRRSPERRPVPRRMAGKGSGLRDERRRGFTPTELMIVAAIIAVIATAPLLSARLAANEKAGVATSKAIMTAQAQMTSDATIDANVSRAGDYGYLQARGGREGGPAPTVTTVASDPLVVSQAYAGLDGAGRPLHSGPCSRSTCPEPAAARWWPAPSRPTRPASAAPPRPSSTSAAAWTELSAAPFSQPVAHARTR